MLVLPEERPGTFLERGTRAHAEAVSAVTELNPLDVTGWDALVSDFSDATPFHTTGWLRVLRETYGHTPFYLCRFSGKHLAACLPLIEVRSPLTGKRGVSLPFTDHCPALVTDVDASPALWNAALAVGHRRGWKYVECRSSGIAPAGGTASLEFYTHSLDLRPGPQALLAQLDSSVRRALRKAESSGLKIELSSEPSALTEYYQLHCLTRRRHGIPPQPWGFFQNLGRHLIAAGQGLIVTARYDGRPVASAVFLHFGEHALYKFGASDSSAQQWRPNNLVLWEAIRYYAPREFRTLDFGRTSLANNGLRRFKCGFGAQERRLVYYSYDLAARRFAAGKDHSDTEHSLLFRRLPLPLLRLAGRLLYPHLA